MFSAKIPVSILKTWSLRPWEKAVKVMFKEFLDCDEASRYRKMPIYHMQPCRHLCNGLAIEASVIFISNTSLDLDFKEEKLNIYSSSSKSCLLFTGEDLQVEAQAVL